MNREIVYEEISGTDVFGDSSLSDSRLFFHPELHDPRGGWTGFFLNGLKVNYGNAFAGKNVIEVGCGGGYVGLAVLTQQPAAWLGTDLNSIAVDCAQRNIDCIHPNPSTQIQVVQANLLQGWETELAQANYVLACIPQVPSDHVDRNTIETADYYISDGSPWDNHGLGLVQRLLGQHKEAGSQAKLIMPIGGRPGESVIKDFFVDQGFSVEIKHSELIPQDPHTSLQSLVAKEQDGVASYEFFADAEAAQSLNTAEAEARRLEGQSVFHYLYLIEATPLSKGSQR